MVFVSVNFPLVDLRGLHKEGLGRLARPAWGNADPNAEFARGFGKIHTRTKSGRGFLGETYYADCNQIIKYPHQIFIDRANEKYGKILINPTYRRFYFDGQTTGRFELGFKLNPPSIFHIEMVAPESRYDVIEIASQILKAESQINLLGRVDKRDSQIS